MFPIIGISKVVGAFFLIFLVLTNLSVFAGPSSLLLDTITESTETKTEIPASVEYTAYYVICENDIILNYRSMFTIKVPLSVAESEDFVASFLTLEMGQDIISQVYSRTKYWNMVPGWKEDNGSNTTHGILMRITRGKYRHSEKAMENDEVFIGRETIMIEGNKLQPKILWSKGAARK